MVEEPENTPETPVEPEPVLVRIEVDAQKALQTIEGFLPAAEGRLHQELDAWWAEVVLNVGSSIPTAIHNQLHDLKEGLRARLVDLFHKEK